MLFAAGAGRRRRLGALRLPGGELLGTPRACIVTAAEPLPGLGGEDVGRGPAGNVERAVRESITAARLDKLDVGAGELAAALARAVDVGLGRRDPFAVAQAAGPLREQLMRLRLDPASRQDSADGFAAWLDSLDDDPDVPAAVPHSPEP